MAGLGGIAQESLLGAQQRDRGRQVCGGVDGGIQGDREGPRSNDGGCIGRGRDGFDGDELILWPLIQRSAAHFAPGMASC